jgi:hypothetical protein
MKPVYQTKFAKPDGNCHAACLASIFEIPLESIPSWGCSSFWYDHFKKWMIENFDLQPIDIEIESFESIMWKPHGYHIINGPSVNGDFWHSVVGLNGEIVHDPFPEMPALKEPKTYTIFVASLRYMPVSVRCDGGKPGA